MLNRPNTDAAHIFDVLHRLTGTNRLQLAERLGVHPMTLSKWLARAERGEPLTREAKERTSALLISLLTRSGALEALNPPKR